MRFLPLAALAALAVLVLPSAAYSADVVLVNQTWICSSAVDLDLVSVTINDSTGKDGLSLRSGCTGHIHELRVLTNGADGIKITNSNSAPAHDLTVDFGSVVCNGHPSGAHQDGIQAMAGMRITLNLIEFDCASSVSNLRLSKAGGMVTTPTDVVCDRCVVRGPWAVIGNSIRSGLRNSYLCSSGITITPAAVDPVNENNIALSDERCNPDPVGPPGPVPPPPPPGVGG